MKLSAFRTVLVLFFVCLLLFLCCPQVLGSEKSLDLPTFAFYYPWYGMPSVSGYWYHWNNVNHDPDNITDGRRSISAVDYPLLDVYDSNDEAVVSQHVQWAKQAGIGCFIVSWWGISDFTDNASRHIRMVCERDNFTFTFYLEQSTSVNQTIADITYLLNTYGDSSSFYKIDGRPVIFVYQRARDSLERGSYPSFDNGWRDVIQALRGAGENPYVVMDFGGYEYGIASFAEYFAGFVDGFHVYNDIGVFSVSPSVGSSVLQYIYDTASDQAHLYNKTFIASVVPGFNNVAASNGNDSLIVDRQNGTTYRLFWQIAEASGADGYAVTSFNEWHEGTEIEPSREYDSQYLSLTSEFTIPESPILPLIMAAALIAVVLVKKRNKNNTQNSPRLNR